MDQTIETVETGMGQVEAQGGQGEVVGEVAEVEVVAPAAVVKNKGGRPRKANARVDRLVVMVSREEREDVERQAVACGRTVSAYVRGILLEAGVLASE